MTRLFFLFSFLIFNSCTWNELPEIICVPDQELYSQSVQPIIEENCMSCHSVAASSSLVLESYDDVINALSNHLLKEVVINRSMPPIIPLSEIEISIIQKWADCE